MVELMDFNINTEPRSYFRQLIEILSVFAPFNSLRKRQKDVFAEMLYQNYLLRDQEDEVRRRLLFDYKTKTEIMDSLDISRANLHNIYKELRQKKIIETDRVNPKFLFGYMKISNINFVFNDGTDTG